MTREGLARGRCSFSEQEEFCSVVGRPLAVKPPGIGAPVNRFAVNYRELANLEAELRPF